MTPAFFLVHGTWSPAAAWTRTDSPLACALRERFGPGTPIEAIGWQGWNRVGTRSRGARRLAEAIRRLPEDGPRRAFVIAHSHGGNVALYALNEPGVAARLGGVAALATPFLVVRRRALAQAVRDAPAWALMIPTLLWMSACAVLTSRWVGGAWGWVAFAVMFGAGVALVGGLMVAWRRLVGAVERSMRFGEVDPERLLILRSPADEASVVLTSMRLVLTLGTLLFALASRAYRQVLHWAGLAQRHPVAVALGALAAFAAGLAGVWAAVVLLQPASGWGWFLALAPPLALLLLLAFPLTCALLDEPGAASVTWVWLLGPWFVLTAVVPSLPLLLYGWQLAVANFALDVSAEATPLGTWTVTTLAHDAPLGDDRSLLVHSALYDDPRAIARLLDWVQQVLSRDAASAAAHGAEALRASA